MRVDSLIMPQGYIPDFIAPDGGLFKTMPGKLQRFKASGIGEVDGFLTLIADEGMMKGYGIDVRKEEVYMTLETAQHYGCVKVKKLTRSECYLRSEHE